MPLAQGLVCFCLFFFFPMAVSPQSVTSLAATELLSSHQMRWHFSCYSVIRNIWEKLDFFLRHQGQEIKETCMQKIRFPQIDCSLKNWLLFPSKCLKLNFGNETDVMEEVIIIIFNSVSRKLRDNAGDLQNTRRKPF